MISRNSFDAVLYLSFSFHLFSSFVFRYNLELIRYEGRIKENLAALKEGYPNVKAVLMGTRKTDPHSGQCIKVSRTPWVCFSRLAGLHTC